MDDDLVKHLRNAGRAFVDNEYNLHARAADRIEQLEKGFRDILTLDDPMLMKMIAKACLTGAIDNEGKYCFVPPFALGEKKDV